MHYDHNKRIGHKPFLLFVVVVIGQLPKQIGNRFLKPNQPWRLYSGEHAAKLGLTGEINKHKKTQK